MHTGNPWPSSGLTQGSTVITSMEARRRGLESLLMLYSNSLESPWRRQVMPPPGTVLHVVQGLWRGEVTSLGANSWREGEAPGMWCPTLWVLWTKGTLWWEHNGWLRTQETTYVGQTQGSAVGWWGGTQDPERILCQSGWGLLRIRLSAPLS